MSGSAPRAYRVLVVEDDGVTALFLRTVLEHTGRFAVTDTADAERGRILLRTQDWDLLIVDVGLPGMTGLELLRVLPSDRQPPTIVITGTPTLDVALDAMRAEADDLLAKPVDPTILLAKATELAGRPRRRVEAVRILAIGAHPDDVEIGCAGSLLVHRARGDTIAIMTMSRGEHGGDQQGRAMESERSAGFLGARLFLEDLEDTAIPVGNPTVGMIEEVVRAFGPTVVYTHSVNDLHQDHRAVHRAAMVAVRRVPHVYCFQSPSATVEFRPTRFIPIDGHLEGKLEAIRAFESQTASRDYLDEELIRSTARYWGRFGGGRYAEPLEVVRDQADADQLRPPFSAEASPSSEGDHAAA
jgi:LmbE family N-acetylglucosaminyl deacetylase/ActR/RegA family two-component response regulator